MKLKYKVVMFLTLLILCVGSVCAAEPNNTTSDNVIGDVGLSPVNPPITNTTDVVKIVNSVVGSELEKRDTIIQNQELRIKNLENNSAEKDIRINELNNTVNNQSVIINSLKDDNKILTDSNKVLTDRVQALEYSKLTQSNRIKSLEIDIKNLEESNKQLVNSNKQLVDSNRVLNNTVNSQAVKINELNNTVNN
ncbi:MAG: hypothetical protein MJ224_06665, partial [archaeon]|nr:hypothetical protein [archaeon]